MQQTDPCELAPEWVLEPLPANAVSDEKLFVEVDQMAANLPDSLWEIHNRLLQVKSFCEYDAAANRAAAHVWLALDKFWQASPIHQQNLLYFADQHMNERACARIVRRLVHAPERNVRRQAQSLVTRERLREVALPNAGDAPWNPTGWCAATKRRPFFRHAQGARVRERLGLPNIATIAELRELLNVRSAKQLGWFFLATDQDNGPYTSFVIPKRGGERRKICAPKAQLCWTQRRILRQILDKIPVHQAAHGFVTGRSTVTNAAAHQGAKILIKFDLADFFPTISYFRVIGLFASLGYSVEDVRFQTNDDSRQVATALARLCCYTPDPKQLRNCTLPQGAPTSPAVSNLICRRLDARLTGLAKRNGGVYTRYADDLTFSIQHDEVDLGRLRWWVDQICHQEGFLVNQGKFRVIRASQRQSVTGIVVNDTLRIPREARRRFRAVLYNCRKHGVSSQARGRKDFAGYLRGFASYVYMVDSLEGKDLLAQVRELLGDGNQEQP